MPTSSTGLAARAALLQQKNQHKRLQSNKRGNIMKILITECNCSYQSAFLDAFVFVYETAKA